MLGDTEVAELTALRRRAYSADADIASDPVALARLDELERAVLPRSPASEDDAGRGDPGGGGSAGGGDGDRLGHVVDRPGRTLADGDGDGDGDNGSGGIAADAAARGAGALAVRERHGSREPGLDIDPFAVPDPATAASSVPTTHPRRSWPARIVVAAAVPAAALMVAFGFVFGSRGAAPAATPTPSPTPASDLPPRPGFADSYAWARYVRTWDIESLRVLARIDGTRIWAGTVGDGVTTCVAIDDQRTDPVACRLTADVTREGIVIDAPRSRDDDTIGVLYVVNPYGEPTVMVERLSPGG